MTDQWVPAPPQPPPTNPPPGLPPANSWSPVTPCAAPDSPSIANGVIITGVPATILAPNAWGITLNDGGAPPNFTIDHYDASGVLIDHPIDIDGTSGDVTLTHDPTQPLGVATKEYVDTRALADAPNDANAYGRMGGAWRVVTPEAPIDGYAYARQLLGWTRVNPNSLTDAPTDGQLYGRANAAWATAYSTTNPANYQTAAQVVAALVPFMRIAGGSFTGGVGFNAGAIFSLPTLLAIGGGTPGQTLVSNASGTLSWAAPGLADAPSDGQFYTRQNAAWAIAPGGMTDAPNDGTAYARKSAAWAHLTHTDITDWTATLAPYALIANVPVASTSTPLMDGTAAVGTGTTWARADHVHPTPVINPNRLDNGDMLIDQHHSGASVAIAAGTLYYIPDRWYFGSTKATLTAGQNYSVATKAPGFQYFLGAQVTGIGAAPAAADASWSVQSLEFDAFNDLMWGTVNAQPATLSFWVNSSLTGNFSVALQGYSAPVRAFITTYNIPTANTWTKITIPIPGDIASPASWTGAGNAQGVALTFDLGVGANFQTATNLGAWQTTGVIAATGSVKLVATSNARWAITGVKLEAGNVATPYPFEDLPRRLARCQRYFFAGQMILTTWGNAGQVIYTSANIPVPMRSLPTLTAANTSGTNVTGQAVGAYNNTSIYFSGNVTAAGSAQLGMTYTASAEI